MSTIKADIVQNTAGGATTLTDLYPARAWATFDMGGTASLIADGGISSLTDLTTGTPQFNLSTSLTAVNGAVWTTCAMFSSSQEYAVQGGGRITSTSAFKTYCGSDTTGRQDWRLGYSGIVR